MNSFYLIVGVERGILPMFVTGSCGAKARAPASACSQVAIHHCIGIHRLRRIHRSPTHVRTRPATRAMHSNAANNDTHNGMWGDCPQLLLKEAELNSMGGTGL